MRGTRSTICVVLLTATLCCWCCLSKHAPEHTNEDLSYRDEDLIVTLTDLNFDRYVNSSSPPWMIDVGAPWCPACIEMEPAWKKMAQDVRKDGILVGKVDGTTEHGLLRRLRIQHFPTILRISGNEMREHLGERTSRAMTAFARKTWVKSKPSTGCAVPTSFCGRLLGEFYKVPARVKVAYRVLKEEKEFSDTAILGLAVSVPVTVGLTAICLLDAYVRSIPLRHGEHLHQS